MSANRASSLRFDEHAVSVVLDAIRATGDLMLHTAQPLRVVTISNVGGTPPPRGLPKLKIWNFNMLRRSLARQFHFAAQTETVGPSHSRISNSATCGSFLLRRKHH
jgi:hypothetical protein